MTADAQVLTAAGFPMPYIFLSADLIWIVERGWKDTVIRGNKYNVSNKRRKPLEKRPLKNV